MRLALGGAAKLVALLRNVMHRNHLHVDERPLYKDCRVGAKHAVEAYRAEVVASLRWLQGVDHPQLPPAEKLEFFQRCSVCLGNTALSERTSRRDMLPDRPFDPSESSDSFGPRRAR